MTARQKLEPLYLKLSITNEKVKRKAEELVRRLDLKAPTGIKSMVHSLLLPSLISRPMLASMLCACMSPVKGKGPFEGNLTVPAMKFPLIAFWLAKHVEWTQTCTEMPTNKSLVFYKSSRCTCKLSSHLTEFLFRFRNWESNSSAQR